MLIALQIWGVWEAKPELKMKIKRGLKLAK
jgi:hypothetical protein